MSRTRPTQHGALPYRMATIPATTTPFIANPYPVL